MKCRAKTKGRLRVPTTDDGAFWMERTPDGLIFRQEDSPSNRFLFRNGEWFRNAGPKIWGPFYGGSHHFQARLYTPIKVWLR